MEQIKNVIKIDGDKNHVSQGTGVSIQPLFWRFEQ